MRRLLGCLVVLLLGSVPAASAATTSWTNLPAPWYAPSLTGFTDDAPAHRLNTTSSVKVVGRYAYSVGWTQDRITVTDVQDPSAPVVVGSLADPAHLDAAAWIDVVGNYAYVTSKGASNASLAKSGLTIYDISDPKNPAYVGSVTNDARLYGAYGLQVVGSTAYVAAQGCIGGSGCVSTYPGGNALTIVDVSNPANPTITGSVSHLPETSHLDSIAVVGNRAYGTAFYSSSVTSFDVSDPAHPAILASRQDTKLAVANDIGIIGHYAAVVDQSTSAARVSMIDVGDPTLPIVGSVQDNTYLSYGYRLRTNSRYAFVDAVRADAVTVVDLADPATPTVVASIADPVKIGQPVALDLVGDTAYAGVFCTRTAGACDANYFGGLSAIDVSAFGDSAPDTAFASTPPPVDSSTTASFSFSATRRGASFTCSLDGGAAAPCSSPATFSGLAAGDHTVAVTSTSLAGVSDPSPATYAWTISFAAPDTSITAAPSGVTRSTSATVSFASSPAGATFLCQLDGGSWAACTSPTVFNGLADGPHDLAVAASNNTGADQTPAHATWTVDTVAPRTTLASVPPTTTTSTSATLTFTVDDAAATSECRLDGGGWSGCTSPTTYDGLAIGAHTADVRSTDAAGNVESAPASVAWTVTAPPATVTPTPDAGPTAAPIDSATPATTTTASPGPTVSPSPSPTVTTTPAQSTACPGVVRLRVRGAHTRVRVAGRSVRVRHHRANLTPLLRTNAVTKVRIIRRGKPTRTVTFRGCGRA